ncbi:MAG: CBS domain-containing protein [Alphaproteobacteria bacterium]
MHLHLVAYVTGVLGFMISDYLTPGPLWFHWPAMAWGVVMGVHFLYCKTLQLGGNEAWADERAADIRGKSYDVGHIRSIHAAPKLWQKAEKRTNRPVPGGPADRCIGGLGKMHAKDIMTANVVTVTRDMSVPDIASLLLTRNISGVPVVDDNGAVVGIVTEGDLIQHEDTGEAGERHTSWWLRLFGEPSDSAGHYIKTHGKRAEDVMTRDVVSVDAETPVGDIARIMAERHIKRVPVMSDGALVGIVSRSNLLRGVVTRDTVESPTADDRSIKEAILKEVNDQHWVSHGTLNVIVSGGVVELWGWVESAEERHALVVLAEGMDGVRRVEDHLGSIPRYLEAT